MSHDIFTVCVSYRCQDAEIWRGSVHVHWLWRSSRWVLASMQTSAPRVYDAVSPRVSISSLPHINTSPYVCVLRDEDTWNGWWPKHLSWNRFTRSDCFELELPALAVKWSVWTWEPFRSNILYVTGLHWDAKQNQTNQGSTVGHICIQKVEESHIPFTDDIVGTAKLLPSCFDVC